MLTRIDVTSTTAPLGEVLPKPADAGVNVAEIVKEILDSVKVERDTAVRRWTERLDGVSADPLVPSNDLTEALKRLDPALRDSLEFAWAQILAFHVSELSTPPAFVRSGVEVEHRTVPVDRAGIYAPGGRARYPSSVLMAAGAARAAGVPELVLCCPPGPDGVIDQATLAAAAIAGITEVYAIGGAQAIGAMAFGTETISPVDVVAGPGNAYVAEAKRQVLGVVGVASGFAGPSEIAVLVDGSVDPMWAAIDLMVQAEHGPDGLAWLIGTDASSLDAVDAALETLVLTAPRRAEIEATFASGGYAVLARDVEQALAVIDVIAAEHVELLCANGGDLARRVKNAGAIFVGPYGAASIGDYVAGPNHVLPTSRTARFASALRADDFVKHHHIVTVSREGFDDLADHVERIATCEGLDAHAQSIAIRR
ncbi:MAG: histidinol dehydrogenase [Actinomycetota bacterium]